jgi:hypothetical protein
MTAHRTSFPLSGRRSSHVGKGSAIAAAAVIVLTACSSGSTDDATADDPEPSAAAATAPPTTSAPTPAQASAESTAAPAGLVTATSSLGDVPVTFTVPDGWSTALEGTVLKGAPEYGVFFWNPLDRIYTDSCPSTMVDPPPGPTVDDFAAVWADLPGFKATAPVDISVDGFAGKLVEFTVPDYDEDECPYGEFMLLGDASGDGYWAQAPNGHHQLRILDVDGTRLVITSFWYPDTPAEDRAAIDEIIGSIRIG